MTQLQEFLAKINTLSELRPSPTTSELLAQWTDIVTEFSNLPRRFELSVPLTEIKFSLQRLRRQLFNIILNRPVNRESIQLLGLLHLTPTQVELNLMCQKVLELKKPELEMQMADILATMGAHHQLLHLFAHHEKLPQWLLMAGPRKLLPMIANRRSRATQKRWVRNHIFAQYQFSENGVIFRGMELKPGDMILSSVNLDGNGVYTTLVEPKGYAYHFGIFAIIEHGGLRFPCVVETYEIGVRLVPLHQFLSKQFNCYFEVCRLNNVPGNFYSEMNRLAAELPAKVKGYNFDTEDPDHTYLACTSVATYLLSQINMRPIATQSHYSKHPQLLRNLQEIELKTGPFLSPWDFMTSDRTHFVGHWDNDFFLLNICREMCERAIDKVFKSKQFSISRAPLLYYFNSFGVKQIQRNTLLGKVIGKIVGFNHENLPAASHKVLGMIEIFEHTMEKCVRALYQELKSTDYLAEYSTIESYSLKKDSELQRAIHPFVRLFRGKPI